MSAPRPVARCAAAARHAAHLARRWRSSLRPRPLSAAESRWVDAQLEPAARRAWDSMPLSDQRHALGVAARFLALAPHADRAEVAAALLHDVGKADLQMGWASRVVATLVGRRGSRFRAYHDHERRGAALLTSLGVDPRTVELVAGRGARAAALRAADDAA